MKLRALDDNHDCWKKGDEFECRFDRYGCAYVECHAKGAGGHFLIDRENGYTKDPLQCPDFVEIKDGDDAPPVS